MTLRFGVGDYTVSGTVGALPSLYSEEVARATLHDDFEVEDDEGTTLVISVGSGASGWPELVVSQRFSPGRESGFDPGVLLVPETHLLLIGAGTRLLGYTLRPIRRLWEAVVELGFWGWKRHGEVVLMSAELELAAWDLSGKKLWSTEAEPPWDYQVRGARVELEVMGKTTSFDLGLGPG